MISTIFLIALGIAVFLLGLLFLTSSLKIISRHRVKTLIEKYTGNIYVSIFIGFILAIMMQSSSMITIVSVSMADAGLLNLYSAAGIIMGANIGTTIAVQLYAFDLYSAVPYLIFLGSIFRFQKQKTLKFIGNILLGFGIIFAGLKIIDIAVSPLRSFSAIKNFVAMTENPFYGIVTGIFMALIMQSSTFCIAMLQVLANVKIMPVFNAIYIVYGLNIGTCSEALLMSIATNKEGKKIAVFNVLFNLIGTIVFLPFTHHYYKFLKFITPNNEPLQISNSHMFFNIASTLLVMPIMKYLFSFIEIMFENGSK